MRLSRPDKGRSAASPSPPLVPRVLDIEASGPRETIHEVMNQTLIHERFHRPGIESDCVLPSHARRGHARKCLLTPYGK